MNQETLRKLTEMKMGGMADIYQQQSQNREYQKMDFDDRFQLLVDYEYDRRRSNKLERLIKQATLNEPAAAIEDIEYHPERKLNKQLILELAGGNYIQRHHNIILMGASGNGKTWIANAFGVQACRQFYNVKYIRLTEQLDEFFRYKNL
jgi:DNA replication protein DnaC